MVRMFKKWIFDEEGQGLIEYVLIIVLIAIVLIVALSFFGVNLRNYYDERVVNRINATQ